MIDLTKRHFFEGSMGTMLQSKGLGNGELPESWNITNPQAVQDIHKSYKAAGCNIHKTNTFGANPIKLEGSGYGVNELVRAGVAIAKEVAKSGYVALSVGPSGKLLAPFGDLGFEEAVKCFSETIAAGAKAGADIVLIETMSDTYEIKAAMLAAKECCNLPIFVTFTIDEKGRLLTGGDISTAVCMIEALGASAIGFNCGLGPSQMKEYLPEIVTYSSLPIIINPNAGMPTLINGKTVFGVEPEEFAGLMEEIATDAMIVGGCCGTTPQHMKKTISVCTGKPFVKPVFKDYTAVSSYSKTVFFGSGTILIGERINPTGKPRMKQALKENDMGYMYNEGISQAENGAEILDVNVGIPGIDERTVLASVVCGLQTVTDAPLQIDTSDPEAAEMALRLYNGRPLLNSVSGKEESLAKILPLVKKYGAVVVALALDDAGIPETAEGRIEIAKKIISRAANIGIHKKNIIVDTLTLTIGTGELNAKITLEAIRLAKEELGVHTVLGVSNISFGLPSREAINAAFFTLAQSNGLSSAIINPMSKPMMDAYYTYKVLAGQDKDALMYIKRFAADKDKKPLPVNADLNLKEAVIKGMRDQAAALAGELAKNTPPLEIINSHLIPALNEVGEKFEKRAVFLPQLLMSAEAAKSAFESIKTHMSAKGETHKKRGKVILATVLGDVHDIGKNIVKVLLENYNFEVIDLGKNVEPNLVVETAVAQAVNLVGLSALMTTTVTAMEETILQLKKALPNCRVKVGGAVLTEDFAKSIGADFYAKDAMSGVRYAEEVL